MTIGTDKKIFTIITLLFSLLCACLFLSACQTESVLSDSDLTTVADTSLSMEGQEEVWRADIAAMHNQVDDAIIPLACYNEQLKQITRYDWNIETGQVTNTFLPLFCNVTSHTKIVRWNGGNYLILDGWGELSIPGPGMLVAKKRFDTPCYQDYWIENFNPYTISKPMDEISWIITNGEQRYTVDFVDIQFPNGKAEDYQIASFYLEGNIAYFLLVPVVNDLYDLIVVDYDLQQNCYTANAVVNSPQLCGPEMPFGTRVNSSGNTFLVCNSLDGLYEIDGPTYTAHKLYDNWDFTVEEVESDSKISIIEAGYYNGYLLLKVYHYLSDDSALYLLVVLKDGEQVATLTTKQGVYFPSL